MKKPMCCRRDGGLLFTVGKKVCTSQMKHHGIVGVSFLEAFTKAFTLFLHIKSSGQLYTSLLQCKKKTQVAYLPHSREDVDASNTAFLCLHRCRDRSPTRCSMTAVSVVLPMLTLRIVVLGSCRLRTRDSVGFANCECIPCSCRYLNQEKASYDELSADEHAHQLTFRLASK
jgi:hypothetical protein